MDTHPPTGSTPAGSALSEPEPSAHDPSTADDRTSPLLIPLWFLLAGAAGAVLFHTGWLVFMMLLIHANSSLVLVVATLVSATVLLAWLVPVAITHLVLVCRRRRSSLRSALGVVQWVIVALFFFGVWFLLLFLLGPE